MKREDKRPESEQLGNGRLSPPIVGASWAQAEGCTLGREPNFLIEMW